VPVTDETPAPLPPDPEQYDAPRNVAARRRGLDQAYISGGEDPELDETLRHERPYRNLLIAMVVAIIAMGFGLGLVAALIASQP
jgi:hypothetical protein